MVTTTTLGKVGEVGTYIKSYIVAIFDDLSYFNTHESKILKLISKILKITY